MSRLAKQILAAREVEVSVGEWVFTVRRPDTMATGAWVAMGREALVKNILEECVVNWRGVLERDLIGSGGSDQEVPFDAEDYRVWIRDKPDCWGPISQAVLDAVTSWNERVQAERKN